MSRPDIRDFCTALIKRTQNPTMPISVQTLADGIEQVRKTMTSLTTQEESRQFANRLLKDFPDDEINQVNSSPAFIVALLVLLYRSMINFTVESLRNEQKPKPESNKPKVDETKCFVCQGENPPTWQATRGSEKFLLCPDCKDIVERTNRSENSVKSGIRQSEYLGRRIFTEALGWNLNTVAITFEPLK